MAESRIAKVEKNVITSMMQNFVSMLLNFLIRMLFIRILDESYLGINGLFSNILSILSLADLGMANVMMYSLYRPIEEGNTIKISALISFFRRIYIIIACTVLLAGLGLVPFLRFIVNMEQTVQFLEGYYILALLNVVMSYLFVYRTTLIIADQKAYILNRYIMAFKVVTFAAQGIMLVLFQNYFVFLAVAVVVNLMSNVCQNAVALRLYPYLKENAPNLEKEERTRIFRDVKAMFIYKIAGTIQGNTDNILISIFVGTVYVGYYSNYALIITQIVMMISLVFNAVKASVGNLIASSETRDEDKFFLFQVCEMLNFWIVGFCSVCFIVLFQDFISICFGGKYVLDGIVVIVIVLNFYTSNIRQTIWMFRETTGIFQETKYVTAVTAVINVVLSLLLGYFWGMAGILLATVLGRMIYAWWKEPLILYHFFAKKNAVSYFISYIKKVLLCTAVCAGTYVLCSQIVLNHIYYKFAVKMLICVIVPNIVFLCLFWRTAEFQYIKEQLICPVLNRISFIPRKGKKVCKKLKIQKNRKCLLEKIKQL